MRSKFVAGAALAVGVAAQELDAVAEVDCSAFTTPCGCASAGGSCGWKSADGACLNDEFTTSCFECSTQPYCQHFQQVEQLYLSGLQEVLDASLQTGEAVSFAKGLRGLPAASTFQEPTMYTPYGAPYSSPLLYTPAQAAPMTPVELAMPVMDFDLEMELFDLEMELYPTVVDTQPKHIYSRSSGRIATETNTYLGFTPVKYEYKAASKSPLLGGGNNFIGFLPVSLPLADTGYQVYEEELPEVDPLVDYYGAYGQIVPDSVLEKKNMGLKASSPELAMYGGAYPDMRFSSHVSQAALSAPSVRFEAQQAYVDVLPPKLESRPGYFGAPLANPEPLRFFQPEPTVSFPAHDMYIPSAVQQDLLAASTLGASSQRFQNLAGKLSTLSGIDPATAQNSILQWQDTYGNPTSASTSTPAFIPAAPQSTFAPATSFASFSSPSFAAPSFAAATFAPDAAAYAGTSYAPRYEGSVSSKRLPTSFGSFGQQAIIGSGRSSGGLYPQQQLSQQPLYSQNAGSSRYASAGSNVYSSQTPMYSSQQRYSTYSSRNTVTAYRSQDEDGEESVVFVPAASVDVPVYMEGYSGDINGRFQRETRN